MTSPNMNVLMMCGATVGYASLVLFGLDSNFIDYSTMSILQQVIRQFVYGLNILLMCNRAS